MRGKDKSVADFVKSATPSQLAKTLTDVQVKIDDDYKPEEDDELSVGSLTPHQDERLAKLDIIQDVQLILIDKYRNGAKLMVAAITIMSFILAAQTLQFSRSLSLHGKVIVIAEKQSAMMREQKQLVTDSAESKDVVDKVRIAVARTEEKVEEAVESAPKLEIDPDSGKTKVVIPVKKPKIRKDIKDVEGKGPPPLPPRPSPIIIELQ